MTPILNYSCAVWGHNEWPDLEKIHLQACKYALGVKSSTCLDAIYSELGRITLLTLRHIDMIKFFRRLSNLDSKRYAKMAFEMLSNDANLGVKNWVSNAKDLVQSYAITDNDSKTQIKVKIKDIFASRMVDKLQSHISSEKKLRTYALFKNSFKFETYLDVITNFKTRSNLCKFRLSSHTLHIETGRYGKNPTPKEERYCVYCKTNSNSSYVEDEFHFLMICPLYAEERHQLLTVAKGKYPNTSCLSPQDLFIWLMSQEDIELVKILAKNVTLSFRNRDKFLSLTTKK